MASRIAPECGAQDLLHDFLGAVASEAAMVWNTRWLSVDAMKVVSYCHIVKAHPAGPRTVAHACNCAGVTRHLLLYVPVPPVSGIGQPATMVPPSRRLT